MRKETEKIIVPAAVTPTKANKNAILKSTEGIIQSEYVHISHKKVICGIYV